MAVEHTDLDTGELVLEAPFFRTQHNFKRDTRATALICLDPTKAQQNFKEETDINTIVRRFGLTGELPDNYRAPQYGDFTGITDYQSALNQVMAAEDSFMQIPAETRAKFHNDPQNLLKFLDNPDNYEEALRLKLVQKRPETPVPGPNAGAPVSPQPEPSKTHPKAD